MSSYRQILKSTSVIGGSSLITILIRMIRIKFVAVLLGPAGMGLMGVYTSITEMVGTMSAMGIRTSGVRQIAEAHGTGNEDGVASNAKTLRRTVWITGFSGMAIMILGSRYLSVFSFGNPEHLLPIAILGVTILLANIAVGQSCILQGTRRIGDLAKVSIIGAINATAISVPCYYFWGGKGIVPSLILISGATVVTSWWYARRVAIKPVRITWKETRKVAAVMLRFGVPFMLATLLTSLTGYLIRILLIREFGLEGVGVWQAAFTLSAILVNFVLSAMGTDYYPHLSAVAHDNDLIKESVNAQTEISLLLSVPGLMATIIFAPLVITIFYSGKFDSAVDILRWSVYGVFGKVVSWPLGFILLAKGMGKTYFVAETCTNIFYVTSVWFCMKLWGLPGTGVAFMVLYIFYIFVVYIIGYTTARVAWNQANYVQILAFGLLLAAVGLIGAFVVNPLLQYTVNIFLLLVVSVFCLRKLMRKSGIGVHAIISKIRNNSTDQTTQDNSK